MCLGPQIFIPFLEEKNCILELDNLIEFCRLSDTQNAGLSFLSFEFFSTIMGRSLDLHGLWLHQLSKGNTNSCLIGGSDDQWEICAKHRVCVQ